MKRIEEWEVLLGCAAALRHAGLPDDVSACCGSCHDDEIEGYGSMCEYVFRDGDVIATAICCNVWDLLEKAEKESPEIPP